MGTNDCEYIFIGNAIWSFNAKAKINEYVSQMGNSDVQYPYALDEFKNIYLFSYDVKLSIAMILLIL